MRRNYLMLLILVVLLVVPALLPAATFWDGMQAPLGQLIGLVLTVFGVPLLLKWSRKAGIEITEQQANAAIDALINILVNIDLGSPEMDGKKKKQMAVYQAKNLLDAETQNVLVKRFGSIEAAVQTAYERSSLNK